MKNVLVFGGLGFIGSNFLRWATNNRPNLDFKIADGYSYAADESRIGDWFSGEVRRCQLQDSDSYEDMMNWADLVINFAAETHNDNSLSAPELFIDSNIVGTFELLQSCRRNDTSLIQVSTDEVYGDFPVASTELATESYPARPSSPYSASKAASDFLALSWVRSFNLRVMVTNCTNNYGPNQHPEKLIPNIVHRVNHGLPVQLYGDGRHVRDWIYVDDHSSAIVLLMEKPQWGERFNISANNEWSNIDLVRQILEELGAPDHPVELVADRPGHDLRYGVDSSKLRALGWKPSQTKLRKFTDGF